LLPLLICRLAAPILLAAIFSTSLGAYQHFQLGFPAIRPPWSAFEPVQRRVLPPTMSLLGPELHAELTELLRALQSPNNQLRSQAEEVLKGWTLERPHILLMGLVEQITASAETGVSRPERPSLLLLLIGFPSN
jgi:hypothetical protein